ncbi:hypothetical protein VPHD249_0147 [Vibrio phage D249]|nr:hypothetical protein SIPHO036v1_70016 [Vibrio phage 70E38.1]QZI88039.1 hypothetical protein SIPHO041v1_p0128 [Vibrio phage 234P1]QZI88321.1 hypothetical protein SIPHO082v1_p0044 [Vibrio phage 294E48.1]QZI88764.1 hypothetical protein SIPHO039v1_p0135 [Vibrio phage 70E35.5a]QZI89074.1 hypothetical protein SIPHO042v1_p0077 [Vibrio phage 70E37.1]QZI89212.1 hypothetical protein SIPHO038v1_p0034 [Vibrio phage 70E37.6]
MGFMDSEYFVVGLCGGLFGMLIGVFILYMCFTHTSYPSALDMKPVKPSERRNGRRNPPPRPGSRPAPPPPPAGIRHVKDGIPPMPKCKPAKKAFHEIYGMVGCPKCAQPHRYGLDREYLDCYLCGYAFDPELEGRRYESYKKENMNVPNPTKPNPKPPGAE